MSFEAISSKDGSMYTKWGACFCSQLKNTTETCISCLNADDIERKGLDWDKEYEKAADNDFK